MGSTCELQETPSVESRGMVEVFETLRVQALVVALVGLMLFMFIAVHATCLMNVVASGGGWSSSVAARWTFGGLLIAISTMFHLATIASAAVLLSQAGQRVGISFGVVGLAVFGTVSWKSWRGLSEAERDLAYLLDEYDIGRIDLLCLARRTVFADLTLTAVRAISWWGAFSGLILAVDTGDPVHLSFLAAVVVGGVSAAGLALVHRRSFTRALFLRTVGQLYRDTASAPDLKRHWWEEFWLPSETALRSRRSSAPLPKDVVRRSTRLLRDSLLRLGSDKQVINRKAFNSAADGMVRDFSKLAAVEGDLHKHPAVQLAIRLVAAEELTLLGTSWAEAPEISDSRAWRDLRPRRWIATAATCLSVAVAVRSMFGNLQ